MKNFPSKSFLVQLNSSFKNNRSARIDQKNDTNFNFKPFLNFPFIFLRILGRIDSWCVHGQWRQSLQIYLSLNLWICLECRDRLHRWHAKLCASWLKLLVCWVAVWVCAIKVRHGWWGKCLLKLLMSFRLLGKSCRLLHRVIVELIHVVHGDNAGGGCRLCHYKFKLFFTVNTS